MVMGSDQCLVTGPRARIWRDAALDPIACTAAGPCTALAYYADTTGGFRAGAATS
jgi:hypothetical protein